jgi:hypothetical protein
MSDRTHHRYIIGLWVGWLFGLGALMGTAGLRFQPQRPDTVLPWTADVTTAEAIAGRAYLREPFLNFLVNGDSEHYLSIAVVGYDDPLNYIAQVSDGRKLSINYGFMPLYPLLMRVIGIPLVALGMNAIAAHTLAGVLISAGSTLVALLVLFNLTKHALDAQAAQRAIYYLLIFPAAFFMLAVYTEGLFLALALSSLVLMRRNQLIMAALLAAIAVWVRLVGLALVLPLALTWWTQYGPRPDRRAITLPPPALLGMAAVALPLLMFVLWRVLLGDNAIPMQALFGRSTLDIVGSAQAWGRALVRVIGVTAAPSETRLYYALEIASLTLALLASLAAFRADRNIALFSLASVIMTATGGVVSGQLRYTLAAPAVFLILAHLGRSALFDRLWNLISVLLLGIQAALFAFDFWVA